MMKKSEAISALKEVPSKIKKVFALLTSMENLHIESRDSRKSIKRHHSLSSKSCSFNPAPVKRRKIENKEKMSLNDNEWKWKSLSHDFRHCQTVKGKSFFCYGTQGLRLQLRCLHFK